jgi:hypothetical protein
VVDEVPPEFYGLVDEFVNLANSLAEPHDPAQVSACLLYAAARYNAFRLLANHPDDTAPEREVAVSQLVGQYREMLEENLDWLEKNRP